MNKESETTDFKYFEEWYYEIALKIINEQREATGKECNSEISEFMS